MDSFEKMYSVKEAAAVLTVSSDTVLRLVRRKQLKAWRLPADAHYGRRKYESFRIPGTELLAFIKRNVA